MPGSFRGLRGRHSGIEVIPDVVRQAREEGGLSQAAVAEPEFTRGAVCQVEKGRIRPSLRLLRQIAARTGRPIAYFLPSSTMTSEQRAALDQLHQLVETVKFADAISFGEGLLGRDLPREMEAETRLLLGRAYVRSADGTSAHSHLARALELYEVAADQVQMAEAFILMAQALYLRNDNRALSFACQALDICERLRPAPAELLVRVLINNGMIYLRLQDWHRAIDCYRRALDEVGTSPKIRNLAFIHDQLATAYQRVDEFGEALRHSRKAMRLHSGSLDPSDLFRAELNLGSLLLRQGEVVAAGEHLERALALSEELGLPPLPRCLALLAMAERQIARGEFGDAVVNLSEGARLADEIDDRMNQATALRLWGRVHVKRCDYQRADDAFATAARVLSELDQAADLIEVQLEHADALRAQGRIEEAMELYRAGCTSGRATARRVQGGWGDLVAASWR